MTRRSLLIAGAIAFAVAGWLASPHLGVGVDEASAPAVEEPIAAADEEPRLAVRTRLSRAEPVTRELVVNAHTEPFRHVHLKAEIEGRVVEVLKEEGETVAAGEPILRLDKRDREAQLARAEATLRQRELEFEAARRLGDKGFQATTRVAEAEAMLEEARAEVERMRVEINHTEIRAPFAGVLDERPVELGDFLAMGDSAATIVQLDPLEVRADVPEAEALRVRTGVPAVVRFANRDGGNRGGDGDGRREGHVSYLGATASAETRTFPLKVEIANTERDIPAGISAEIVLELDTVPAHRVSPGLLSLNDAGRLGVKAVDGEARVVFHPARIVKSGAEAVWLAGLPEEVMLITVGQGFAAEGQRVRAQLERGDEAPEDGEPDGGEPDGDESGGEAPDGEGGDDGRGAAAAIAAGRGDRS